MLKKIPRIRYTKIQWVLPSAVPHPSTKFQLNCLSCIPADKLTNKQPKQPVDTYETVWNTLAEVIIKHNLTESLRFIIKCQAFYPKLQIWWFFIYLIA